MNDAVSSALDPEQRSEILRWRKEERRRLIEARLAIGITDRRRFSEAIARRLEERIGEVAGRTISAYWPFRGEPELRPFLRAIAARGGQAALPVVVERGRPLVFRPWSPGARLELGVWNIPVPAERREVVPDVVVAPVVGFDRACYRLGYGGGFFDRTLAALPKKPLVLGVGYSEAEVATIHPLPHDIPMDLIVTEEGLVAPGPA